MAKKIFFVYNAPVYFFTRNICNDLSIEIIFAIELLINISLFSVHTKIPVESSESIPVASASTGGGVFRLPPTTYMRTRGVVTAGNVQHANEMNDEQFSNNPGHPASSTIRRDIFLPEIRVNYSDNINLETYSTSPRKYQESLTNTFHSIPSSMPPPPPEFYHTDSSYNRENDNSTSFSGDQLVTAGNSIDRRRSNPQQADRSSECIAKVLCNADIESRINMTMMMPDVTLAAATTATSSSVDNLVEEKCVDDYTVNVPDIASTSEQQQQKRIRSTSIIEEENPEITITDCDNTASNTITGGGMLDRISHDLDYLLNR